MKMEGQCYLFHTKMKQMDFVLVYKVLVRFKVFSWGFSLQGHSSAAKIQILGLCPWLVMILHSAFVYLEPRVLNKTDSWPVSSSNSG